MKNIFSIFFVVLNLTLYSQKDVKLFSKIMAESVKNCVVMFNADTIDYDIPLNNIIIRPISINKSYDTAIFSLEMNCVPIVLQKLQVGGLLKLGKGKSLFIQNAHLPVDFTGINWITDSNLINIYVDSLQKFTKIKPWEPQPLTALCKVYVYPKRDIDQIVVLEVDYYCKRDLMDKKYFPVINYPKNIPIDTCANSPSIVDIVINQFFSMQTFRRRFGILLLDL